MAWGLATRGGQDWGAVESPLNQEVVVQIEGPGYLIPARQGPPRAEGAQEGEPPDPRL